MSKTTDFLTNPFLWATLMGSGAMYLTWEIASGTAFILSAAVTGSAATCLATRVPA